MKWKVEIWTIRNLLEEYDNENIELSPSYQRNPIWTSTSQKKLIDTILAPQPLPAFFLLELENQKYEMVDGQQRSRTIIAYRNNLIKTKSHGIYDELDDKSSFLDYVLNITVITDLERSEAIEEYYALVNRSGLRLNTPELRKAQFYNTRFLALASELADSITFTDLDLFSKNTIKRMNDVELVAELLALLKLGICEKKTAVDELFEDDITNEEADELRGSFVSVCAVLQSLNKICPLNQTRFKQRADIYTLFDFIKDYHDLSAEDFCGYYQILLHISPGIKPSQNNCDPLREYARNCVSQSNSLMARQARRDFFENLLRNKSSKPNEVQKNLIKFDKLELPSKLIKIASKWTIDVFSGGEDEV